MTALMTDALGVDDQRNFRHESTRIRRIRGDTQYKGTRILMILTPRALILTHADESEFCTEILKMEKILKLEQKLENFKFAHGAK